MNADLLPVRQKLWSKRVADLDGEVERLVRRSRLAGRIGPGDIFALRELRVIAFGKFTQVFI